MNNFNVFTISQINFYIRSLFDGDKILENVFLVGEISNFTDHYYSGHLYLSLKDDKSVIKAIMFSSYAKRLKFKPHNGMNVIVRGRISLYEPTGVYQLYIEDMQPDGVGALSLAFEQLKAKLCKEGLFDENRKKVIPEYPEKIGVITSETGAVIQDIKNILNRRFRLAEIVLYPVNVQGVQASEQIIEAVKAFNEGKAADVLIIARGGGSAEDLWIFNDEELARTIASSEIPIISAVGHETDFTICDFVADLRAPTPSAAAELVVPDGEEVLKHITTQIAYIKKLLLNMIEEYRGHLKHILSSNVFKSPSYLLESRNQKVRELVERLELNYSRILLSKRERFNVLAGRLDVLSPLRLLNSGYSLITKDNEDKIIKSIKQVKPNDDIKIRLGDGMLNCKIKSIERKSGINEEETII